MSEEAEWNLIKSVFGREMADTSGPIEQEAKKTVRKLKEKARKDLLKVNMHNKLYFILTNNIVNF